MQAIHEFPDFIAELPLVDLPFPAARGWLLQGEAQQVVFAEFDEELKVPEHSHAEQWEFVLAGKVLLTIAGTSREYLPGEHFYIPAGVPHGATVAPGYKAMILFNAPDRYRAKE